MSTPLNARDVLLQSTSPRFFNEAGQDGLNNATVFIFQRNDTGVAPALPSVNATYTFDPAGITGLNNGWSPTPPSAAGGKFMFFSRAVASAATATDVLAALDWSTAQLLARDGDGGASLIPSIDDTSWSYTAGGATVVTSLTDGKVGPVARRTTAGVQTQMHNPRFFQIDRARKYRVRFWARASATANGLLYFCLRQFLANGTVASTNSGRSPYKPSGIAPHTAWVEYNYVWETSDWQTNVTQVQPDFLLNYRDDAVTRVGYWEIQDLRMWDATEVESAMASAQVAVAAANDISSDGVLDRGEKAVLVLDAAAIVNETTPLANQAAALGVSSTAYLAARAALDAYLGGLSPAWNDTTQNTNITRATYNQKFTDYYTARESLRNALDAKAATTATGLTLSADGKLTGPGGQQGWMTALPTVDLGEGSTTFGQRSRLDMPGEYPMGTLRQFKKATAYGFTSVSTYFALDTFKQYPDASGGGVYQYAYVDAMTYRRWSNNGNGNNSTWSAWVLDLDRNSYTGDLNASSDITLVGDANMMVQGNTLIKVAGGNGVWNAHAYSKQSAPYAYVEFTLDANSPAFFAGLNDNPLYDTSWEDIFVSFYYEGGGAIYTGVNNTLTNVLTGCVSGDTFRITYDGVNVRWWRNGSLHRTLTVDIGGIPLFFDSSFVSIGSTVLNCKFGPFPSALYAHIGGAGRPQDGATVGAPAGTQVAGVDASAVAAGAQAGAALNNPPVLNNVDNINGNIATGGGLKTITTLYPTTTGGTAPFAYTVALAYGDMADMPITITKSSTGGNTDNVIAFKCLGFSSGMVTNGSVTVTSRDAKGQLAIKVIDFYVQTF